MRKLFFKNMDKEKSNLFISFLAIFSIVLSLAFVYYINDWFLSENDVEKLRNPIFTENLSSEEKKVYLLGNSHIGRVDQVFLNNYMKKNGFDHKVYVLETPGSRPSDRLVILNNIISTKPDLVIIGIDPWDLRDWNTRNTTFEFFEINHNPLFDPKKLFSDNLPKGKFYSFDMYNFKNPKLTSLKILDQYFTLDQNENTPKPRTNHPHPTYIANKTELENMLKKETYNNKISFQNNSQISSLEKIIFELTQNEISVVILVTPRPQTYIDSISSENSDEFFLLLTTIEKKYDIAVYSLFTKYADLDIWWDLGHITRHPDGLIYSTDVAEIILENIES